MVESKLCGSGGKLLRSLHHRSELLNVAAVPFELVKS